MISKKIHPRLLKDIANVLDSHSVNREDLGRLLVNAEKDLSYVFFKNFTQSRRLKTITQVPGKIMK